MIAQFVRVLGISQSKLAREWGCTKDKVNRAANGFEPTFTTEEIQNIEGWLRSRFGKGWLDLPRSFQSEEPIAFLQELETKSAEE